MFSKEYIGQEKWLQFFLIRFLGEILFGYNRLNACLKVVVIAEAMMEQPYDVSAIILGHLYTVLDRFI
jgi:hypothetical protein